MLRSDWYNLKSQILMHFEQHFLLDCFSKLLSFPCSITSFTIPGMYEFFFKHLFNLTLTSKLNNDTSPGIQTAPTMNFTTSCVGPLCWVQSRNKADFLGPDRVVIRLFFPDSDNPRFVVKNLWVVAALVGSVMTKVLFAWFWERSWWT